MTNNPPTTVEEYMTALSERDRNALEQLRQTIKAVAPEASETISYRIPTLKQHGMLVAYSAHKNHYSLHAISTQLLETYKDELASYYTTKGSIRFPYGDPLPEALVQKLVKARLEENQARQDQKRAVRTQTERK